jgi:hypothetical protein
MGVMLMNTRSGFIVKITGAFGVLREFRQGKKWYASSYCKGKKQLSSAQADTAHRNNW